MPRDEAMQNTETLLARTTSLIEQAEARYRETTSLLEQNRLTRESAKNYLNHPVVPADERARALRELADWNQEVESDIRHALAEAGHEKTGGAPRKHRKNFIRV
jgi:hypothetical protein